MSNATFATAVLIKVEVTDQDIDDLLWGVGALSWGGIHSAKIEGRDPALAASSARRESIRQALGRED